MVGARTPQYGVLTMNRAKAALPFAGNYRVIDFALSNLSNSGARRVGVIVQYLPSSLIEYVGIGRSWEFSGLDRICKILPPFSGIDKPEWYSDSANTIYQNFDFVEETNPRDVIILFGDQIFNIDLQKVINQHREYNADVTIVVKREMPFNKKTELYGVVEIDSSSKKVIRFCKESPEDTFNNYSTGIYIFKKEILAKYLISCENNKHPQSFSREVLHQAVRNEECFAYYMEGYHNCLADLNDYYQANMDVIKEHSAIKIEQWEIITNTQDRDQGYRPASYMGKSSRIENSSISLGCRIMGTVSNSIISPGVVVEEGAIVKNSVIMHDCIIEKRAVITKVISDKDVIFGENCTVGEDIVPEREIPAEKQITVIGKRVKIPANTVIKSSCHIYPSIDLSIYPNHIIDRGTVVKEIPVY